MHPQFRFSGVVHRFGPNQVNIELDPQNAIDWRRFAHAHGYAQQRNLNWTGPGPLYVTVSKASLVRLCVPGAHVEYIADIRPRGGSLILWGLQII